MRKKPQIKVRVQNGDIKKAIKKWKNKYQEFGIREELVSRKEFKKPSVIKRKQMNDTIRNHQRDLKKQKDNE